ncbi:nucleotide-binding universal stress UspA family protein [Tenacibaculum gallaicum]|uniref:Nucleotide-binding universal stress UspA family protein n=1 Tax=Tenacibaculum gallaicum TaxID=561505 RepID=A0A3E0IDF9_9FLAO|nr:universal stress protein [Tenacibaculum gallaicum]REH56649.1 nucleotide-binding universal stress UspA family protein [Tenacibaculum gallaicum]
MKIKNILVALDLSELDVTLIKYCSMLAKKHETENVYFIHNVKKYEISNLFSEQLENISIEDIIEEELDNSISKHFDADCNYELLVSDDAYTESLISYVANKYHADLIVLGNKNTYKGSGSVSGKLLRMAKCNILSIPKEANLNPENFMVATDFSSASLKAFNIASSINKKKESVLKILNVFKIPQLFFPYIKVDKAREKVEKHVGLQFEKLLNKVKTSNVETLKASAGDDSIPEKIRAVAEKEKTDILFVADKGHNNFTSLLVGSVTEELFTHDLHVPLWVVKRYIAS